MTFTRAKPGGWQNGERLTSDQANQLDTNVSRALDGHGGGEYDPSTPLIIGGAGLRVGEPTDNSSPVRKQDLDDDISALQSTKVTAASARYLPAVDTSIGTSVSFTEVFSYGGFTLDTSGPTHIIRLPSVGQYMVNFNAAFECSNSTQHVTATVNVLVGGSFIRGRSMRARRYSDDQSELVYLMGGFIFDLTTMDDAEVTVSAAASTGDMVLVDGSLFQAAFSIVKISP